MAFFILFLLITPASFLVAFFIFKKLRENENRFALVISIFSFFITGGAIVVAGFFALLYLGAFTR